MSTEKIAGLILAGGRSSRMDGANKIDVKLAGQRLLDLVIERFAPQVDLLALSGPITNGRYPVIKDKLEGYRGPLTGLWSAFTDPLLDDVSRIALVPCDGPFVPLNLVSTLSVAMDDSNADVAVVSYEGKLQPTFSLWHQRTASLVGEAVIERGLGGFKYLLEELNHVVVSWPTELPSPFFNINSAEELAEAESIFCTRSAL